MNKNERLMAWMQALKNQIELSGSYVNPNWEDYEVRVDPAGTVTYHRLVGTHVPVLPEYGTIHRWYFAPYRPRTPPYHSTVRSALFRNDSGDVATAKLRFFEDGQVFLVELRQA